MTDLNTAVVVSESVAAVTTEENTMENTTPTQEVTIKAPKAKSAKKVQREAGVKAPKKAPKAKKEPVAEPVAAAPKAEPVQAPKAKVGVPRTYLTQSEMLSRKGRLIGSDDLQAVITACRYGQESGLTGTDLLVASGVALSCEKAIKLAAEGKHLEAAKAAGSALYVLKRANRVAHTRVECRDKNVRPIIGVVTHYTKTQSRIGDEVEAARKSEADTAKRTEAFLAAQEAGLNWADFAQLPTEDLLDAIEQAIPAEEQVLKVG
jgi:hypothetical protein